MTAVLDTPRVALKADDLRRSATSTPAWMDSVGLLPYAPSQPTALMDAGSGREFARALPDGTVLNPDGSPLARVDDRGYVYWHARPGDVCGYCTHQPRVIYVNGRTAGHVSARGVHDPSGALRAVFAGEPCIGLAAAWLLLAA